MAIEMVQREVGRFYDGGTPPWPEPGGEPPDPATEMQISLVRTVVDGAEQFGLTRRIAYRDRHVGEIVVPPDPTSFASDLTSVPTLFTWLVPKSGAHLPAALIHDGLVHPPGEPTYLSTDGHHVDRVEADRIFRDAMADSGVGVVRRWLVWTAVTLATIWAREATAPSAWRRVACQIVMVITLGSILVLGYQATSDLFDRDWWLTFELPWMGDRPFVEELITGAAGALVVPLLLGVAWGRFRRAGWVAGIAAGLLFHVTLALVAVSALYAGIEWLVSRLSAPASTLLLAGLAAGSAVVFVWALA